MSSNSNNKPMKGGSTKLNNGMKGGSTKLINGMKGGVGAITIKPPTTTKTSTTKPSMTKLSGGSKKSSKDHKKSKKTKKTKKSKKPMPKGFAYCLMCGKQTEMLNPETRTTKNSRKQLVGKGKCGHKVYRFI